MISKSIHKPNDKSISCSTHLYQANNGSQLPTSKQSISSSTTDHPGTTKEKEELWSHRGQKIKKMAGTILKSFLQLSTIMPL